MKLTGQAALDWCENNNISKGKYSLGLDGEVNIEGDFYIEDDNIKEFPIYFGTVTMDFDCSGCTSLISLDGAPQEVRDFYCHNCTSLTSLEGGPEEVVDLYCVGCTSLTSLVGAPQVIDRFDCSDCTSLTSLVGAPRAVENFRCNNCTSLTSLEGVPQEVEEDFYCEGCTSLTLKGIPYWMLNNNKCHGEIFDNLKKMKIKRIAQVRYLEVMIRQLGI